MKRKKTIKSNKIQYNIKAFQSYSQSQIFFTYKEGKNAENNNSTRFSMFLIVFINQKNNSKWNLFKKVTKKTLELF